MITIKSDYSPQAAPDLQEVDNIKMLKMLLHFAGLTPDDIYSYDIATGTAVDRYNEALGEPTLLHEPTGRMVHTDKQWEAAKEAAAAPLAEIRDMLANKGVTINNILVKEVDPGYFSWIKTTVYTGGDAMEAVAQIERPVSDIEAETYRNNLSGYASVYPDKVEAAKVDTIGVALEKEGITEGVIDVDMEGDVDTVH